MTKTWKPGLVALHQSTRNTSLVLRSSEDMYAWVSLFSNWDVNEGYPLCLWRFAQQEGSEWRGDPIWVGTSEQYEEMRAACETPLELAAMARKAAAVVTLESGRFYRRPNGDGVYLDGDLWCDLAEDGHGWSTGGLPWPAFVEEVAGLKSGTTYLPDLQALWVAHHEKQKVAEVRDAAIALLEQRLAQAERECANKDLTIDRQRAALDGVVQDCARLMSRVRDLAGVIDEQRTELTYVRDCTTANEDKLTELAADNALKDREIHRLKAEVSAAKEVARARNRTISSVGEARKGERYTDAQGKVWACPRDGMVVVWGSQDFPASFWTSEDLTDAVKKWGPFEIV